MDAVGASRPSHFLAAMKLGLQPIRFRLSLKGSPAYFDYTLSAYKRQGENCPNVQNTFSHLRKPHTVHESAPAKTLPGD